MSQFVFLQREWAAVFEAASMAEAGVRAYPRTACVYARGALELAVIWVFKQMLPSGSPSTTISPRRSQETRTSRRLPSLLNVAYHMARP